MWSLSSILSSRAPSPWASCRVLMSSTKAILAVSQDTYIFCNRVIYNQENVCIVGVTAGRCPGLFARRLRTHSRDMIYWNIFIRKWIYSKIYTALLMSWLCYSFKEGLLVNKYKFQHTGHFKLYGVDSQYVGPVFIRLLCTKHALYILPI